MEVAWMLPNTIKPWPHRASASTSALKLSSMLENEYNTDAWCGCPCIGLNQHGPL